MSPDLKLATIFVTLHDKKDAKAVLAGFEANRKAIRGEVARRVNLKFAPDVRFLMDDRLDVVDRIDRILRSPAVRRDIDASADDAGDA
jgi:ribosome-binding factor A